MSKLFQPSAHISRREALSRIAALLGGTIVGAEFILNGTRLEGKTPGAPFTAAELALMDEIGETIIPTTDTPGAKDAGIGAFMAMIVTECYDPEDDALFRLGLAAINNASMEQLGVGFVDAPSSERTALLEHLDAHERRARTRDGTIGYLALLKQLTIIGYFTSEVGCTQAMRFAESPGMHIPCAPCTPGDPGWFGNVGRGFKVGVASLRG